MAVPPSFVYDLAFARNLGWLTEAEQFALRGKRVAIAGMGGVGGVHLLTLARLGIGAFHIADFDRFDLANFNRQVGATMATLGRPKVEVLEEMAHAINPDLRIRTFEQGVTPENMEEFLHGVDLFVDGFDFFVLDIRRRVFRRCAELGIPAVTAAPIGMGTAYMAFVPGGMTFEQYFRLEGHPEQEQYLRFLLGLTPKGLHRSYLVDPSRVDLAAKRGPSTVAGCQLCAGVTAVMALKLLLGRGDVQPAPYHHHFDAYRGIFAVTKLRRGNAGLGQRLKLSIARRLFARVAQRSPAEAAPQAGQQSPIADILNAARWAPSGDNDQRWQFETLGEDEVAIRLARPAGDNVYEYRGGEPLLLAGGMLIESLRIAASAHGRAMTWRHEGTDWPDRIVARFPVCASVVADPLYSSLAQRSVDRRRYRARPLDYRERSALREALGDALVLDWYPGLRQRARFARLSAQATRIRLRVPEAFATHRKAVDWLRPLSPTGIPARALGLDRLTLAMLRWSMRSWQRTRLLNRLGGPLMAAFQADYAPILASAACFTVRLNRSAPAPADRMLALLRAGQRLQRFWLTAARLGLALQPLMAMLIFADYGEKRLGFTASAAVQRQAVALAAAFRRVLGAGTGEFVFVGRIGEPRSRQPAFRSVRRPLSELVERVEQAEHAEA